MPVLVVVGCGKAKRTEAAPAGELYTGSYHRAARAAADAVAARAPVGARVMILSARHGLVDLADIIEPYDETLPYWGQLAGPPRVARTVARQVAATGARTVVALCSTRYADVLRHAARVSGADLVEPLAGTTSQGDQLRRYAALRKGEDLADAVAEILTNRERTRAREVIRQASGD